MLISNARLKKKSCSVNGSLLITYKVAFISLQSKGLANFIGGVAFLGFVFLADLLLWWFVFEGKILFPGSDGEIPGVMCLPVPLKMKPALWSSVGRVLCWLQPLPPGPSCGTRWLPCGARVGGTCRTSTQGLRGFQGCSVYFPEHKGWNTGDGVGSVRGLMLQLQAGTGFTNTFCS